jgi:hypothetical protein
MSDETDSETDPSGKYRLRSLEEILAPYSDPETWRWQIEELENPELKAVFEKRLESMEGVTGTSPEAPIKHMLAPITAAEIASARGQDGAMPKPVSPRIQPYSEEQILSCVRAIARALPDEKCGCLARSLATMTMMEVASSCCWYYRTTKCGRPTYEALLALIRARTSVPIDVIVITESEKRDPPPRWSKMPCVRDGDCSDLPGRRMASARRQK